MDVRQNNRQHLIYLMLEIHVLTTGKSSSNTIYINSSYNNLSNTEMSSFKSLFSNWNLNFKLILKLPQTFWGQFHPIHELHAAQTNILFVLIQCLRKPPWGIKITNENFHVKCLLVPFQRPHVAPNSQTHTYSNRSHMQLDKDRWTLLIPRGQLLCNGSRIQQTAKNKGAKSIKLKNKQIKNRKIS